MFTLKVRLKNSGDAERGVKGGLFPHCPRTFQVSWVTLVDKMTGSELQRRFYIAKSGTDTQGLSLALEIPRNRATVFITYEAA